MPSAAFSWFGSEVVSILQLLFFLMLGYAVTRTWIWSRSLTAKKQALAKKLDDVDQVVEEIQGSEESQSDSSPAGKTKVSLRHSNVQQRKKNKRSKDDKQVSSAEQSQEQPAEKPTQQCQVDAPSMEDAVPRDSPQQQPHKDSEDAIVSERVAKMMAKKMERKARKALEKHTLEESGKEEDSHPVAGGSLVRSDIVAIVEAKSDAEALSDDMAQTSSTPSILTPDTVQKDETFAETAPIMELPVEEITDTQKPMLCCDSLDSMETDAQSESDDVYVPSSTPEGISTPEQCLTPRASISEPVMWCGVQQVPQIEGMMAVLIPAEFAPPGAPGPFDGLWNNTDGDKIVIDHEDIEFESGLRWVLRMESITNISVQVGDETFTADLDTATQRLHWSDGDIWTCVGQTDGQQRWAAAREAEGMPPVMFEGEGMMPMVPMVMEVPMEPMPKNMIVPQDAKSWETCWDWQKKGWCPRGAACEWYHPGPQLPQFQSCKPCNSQAPFCDVMDAPFGGPIF